MPWGLHHGSLRSRDAPIPPTPLEAVPKLRQRVWRCRMGMERHVDRSDEPCGWYYCASHRHGRVPENYFILSCLPRASTRDRGKGQNISPNPLATLVLHIRPNHGTSCFRAHIRAVSCAC